MSTEAWVMLGLAVAGYLVTFGTVLGKVSGFSNRMTGLENRFGEMESRLTGLRQTVFDIRDNHISHLTEDIRTVKRLSMSLSRRVRHLPCDEVQDRVKKLEDKFDEE